MYRNLNYPRAGHCLRTFVYYVFGFFYNFDVTALLLTIGDVKIENFFGKEGRLLAPGPRNHLHDGILIIIFLRNH